MSLRKNLITIDLNQLQKNLTAIKSVLQKGTLLMAVVKADAYGHGMVKTAHGMIKAGADQLAVATPDEGVALRQSGVDVPILILGAARENAIEACVENGLTQTVMDNHIIALIEKAAGAMDKIGTVHMKVDTGMRRIGVQNEEEFRHVFKAIQMAPHMRLTGVFTHFADADGEDEAFTSSQLEAFLKLTKGLPKEVLRHTANSAATLRYPQTHLDMVRPGIALYGCPPVETALPLKPALHWETEVVFVKTLKKGETIGYGRTYTAKADRVVATLPVGYGDGYHRAQSNRGYVLVGGQKAPIMGRVCMDQIMVDVTGIENVHVGSPAVLIGRQGKEEITPDEVAKACGTISYEVLLAPTARVERVFVGE